MGDIYYPNNPNRGNCAGLPLNPDGSCTFIGVLAPCGSPPQRSTNTPGCWARGSGKGSTLHANFDAQFGGADNWIYRTDPLSSFKISGNVSYSPRPWMTVGANLHFQQAKNNTSDIEYNQHNYSTSLNAMINPNKYWGLDMAYNFDAIQQNMFLCFAGTVTPPDTTTCAGDPRCCRLTVFITLTPSIGYFALTLTPVSSGSPCAWDTTWSDNQGNTTT